MQVPPEEWRKLSHGERRRLVNKERRRWRRKAIAQKKAQEQAALEEDPEYLEKLCEEEKQKQEEERRREAQSRLEQEAWLRREREAQEIFRKQREKEEKLQQEREERERLIREEWEALEQREREEEEKREKAKREKEERLKEALSVGDRPKVAEQQWHNPLAPDDIPLPSPSSSSADYGTERDTKNCPFYLKTGACRYGDRCSRSHPRPSSSRTLLIPSMYSSLGLVEQILNERNQDAGIEYDEGDLYENFVQFFEDALPEFSKAGKVVQFKVSCNHEPHLRGNVYVQYQSEEECTKAYQLFNGRWYAQKQLSCELSPVQKWKTAICGMFNQRRCPKGKRCNFLHVFRNPGGAFSRADRDLPPRSPSSPPPSCRRSSTSDRRSHRHSLTRGRRSRSRDRKRRRSRSRSRSPSPKFRRRSRYHSRSRSRSRSHSRERGSRSRRSERKERRKRRRSRNSRSTRSPSDSKSDSVSSSSDESRYSREGSVERSSRSPAVESRHEASAEDEGKSERSSSRKKRGKHRHRSSRLPESPERKRSRKENKHKSKKKHKRHHKHHGGHNETRNKEHQDTDVATSLRERVSTESVSMATPNEGGGAQMQEAMEEGRVEQKDNDEPNSVLVNDGLLVSGQGDQMTVGVASPVSEH